MSACKQASIRNCRPVDRSPNWKVARCAVGCCHHCGSCHILEAATACVASCSAHKCHTHRRAALGRAVRRGRRPAFMAAASMGDVSNQAKSDVVPLLKGGAAVLAIGAVITTVRPSDRLPGAWANVSDVLGILYTAAWSYSFYPQFILNWKRKCGAGPNPFARLPRQLLRDSLLRRRASLSSYVICTCGAARW